MRADTRTDAGSDGCPKIAFSVAAIEMLGNSHRVLERALLEELLRYGFT
jgi:hypothetical protein